MKTPTAIGVVAAAVLMLSCGGDDDSAADTDRYCELVAELEATGEEVFAEVPDDASDEDLAAAEAELVQRGDAQLEEMIEVAPEEIAADVEAYIAAFRARGAGEEGADVTEAEERILAFEDENC